MHPHTTDLRMCAWVGALLTAGTSSRALTWIQVTPG
jgi:hypothetical protein